MKRLYIAVLDSVPSYIVPTLVAHSVLSAHLKFANLNDSAYRQKYFDWLDNSFKKVVVKVNPKEFNKIKDLEIPKHLGFENKTLNGEISCIVLVPIEPDNLPNVLKYAKLYAP